jgi:UPF0755 protein
VIDNRLNRDLPLGLDSTIEYALHISSDPTQAQLSTDTPYNTLNRTGLPPGPIDSPDLAAVSAALHAPRGNWIYFVTVDPTTGLTRFTSSVVQYRQWRAEAARTTGNG